MAPDPALHRVFAGSPETAELVVRPPETADDSAWRELADDAAEPNCFYAPALLKPALQHLAGPDQVRLLRVEAEGALIGLMPVVVERSHSRLPVRNTTNWMHAHCFFGAPLVRRGHEQAAWAGFLEQLDRAAWAGHFLHLSGLDVAGANAAALEAVCVQQGRAFREIHRYERALLRSPLSAADYYEANMRAKKRKEFRRLKNRLAELGGTTTRELMHADDVQRWCDDFLMLEAAGWKGKEGTALSCDPQHEAFFRAAVQAAFDAGELCFLRLDHANKPIAMLVNFIAGRGSFSFKMAIDEDMGRYSPGMLIEIENLARVLDQNDLDWMDSCAAPNHPMIDSLWAERRSIAQYRIALNGPIRRIGYTAAGAAESLSRMLKGGR